MHMATYARIKKLVFYDRNNKCIASFVQASVAAAKAVQQAAAQVAAVK